MQLRERIESFAELGEILRKAISGTKGKYTESLNHVIDNQYIKNPWFTPDNVRRSINAIAGELNYDNLAKWTGAYPDLNNKVNPRVIGVIMAGNIPLVGFHDFLSVLISGHNILARTSSKDSELIVTVSKIICDINQEFNQRINFTGGTMSGFDAIIATGSDNSSRYFEYYFSKYPRIIRKNRTSVGIISGNETSTELEALGIDIFSYFGLGCRNVSKIFIPPGFDISCFKDIWKSYAGLVHHQKYANNYDFNKAVFIVNKEKFTDTGYLLLREAATLVSPVSVLNYEYYSDVSQVNDLLEIYKEKIQCISGLNHVPFGKTQSPALWDYADGTDTIQFLLKKISTRIL